MGTHDAEHKAAALPPLVTDGATLCWHAAERFKDDLPIGAFCIDAPGRGIVIITDATMLPTHANHNGFRFVVGTALEQAGGHSYPALIQYTTSNNKFSGENLTVFDLETLDDTEPEDADSAYTAFLLVCTLWGSYIERNSR